MDKFYLVPLCLINKADQNELKEKNRGFNAGQIVQMNALARIEVSKGNTKLNNTLMIETDDIAKEILGLK